MALVKRIASAYLFENGNICCCDIGGNQIPEVQGPYSIDLHKRVILEAVDTCEFKGFQILPFGFLISVNSWADHFCKQNLSWDEINNL